MRRNGKKHESLSLKGKERKNEKERKGRMKRKGKEE
jgi:hypothetical protein